MKFEKTDIFNFEGALRGMRNPLNSWNKTDSYFDTNTDNYIIGEEDMKLAHILMRGGSEEYKFLRQIFVSVDISAPLYWWSEFDTYKVATVANSTSTMHTLSKNPIELSMFALDENTTEKTYFEIVINHLEELRKKYNDTKDYKWFRLMKQELPSSFIQTRTVTLNYAILRNIYNQRKNHRLKEWSSKDDMSFCKWIISLPYSKELITYGN